VHRVAFEREVHAHPGGVSGRVGIVGSTGATVSFTRRGDEVELTLSALPDPGDDRDAAIEAVTRLALLVKRAADQPELAGARVHLAAEHDAAVDDPVSDAVARMAGLTDRRDLLQLRRPLPVQADHPARPSAPRVALRPFRLGRDVDAWLRVNNRAFADHPDQGRETAETLTARMAEPWYDPADFLVSDDPARPGELTGFCWTKRHRPADPDPALGEIYVIAVDPSHRGEGQGPSFVLAGLDHLSEVGLRTAVLYVDADNGPARRLYDRLGFVPHRIRRVYSAAP